ncbi:MAG TPA: hypothetical protein VGD87_18220, partial [Archangium sp.]
MHPTLENLVPAPLRSTVEALLAAPPALLLDAGDLEGPESRQVLALAILAAATPALHPLLDDALAFLAPKLAELSEPDRGRYWHLRGVSAARERDFLRATVSMNRALALVPPRYRPRVHDSFGRLL